MGLEQYWEERGIEKGLEKGLLAGRLLGHKDAVLRLYRKGHTASKIADLLELPYIAVQKMIDEEE